MELCAFYCSEHILTALILRTTLQVLLICYSRGSRLGSRDLLRVSWLVHGLRESGFEPEFVLLKHCYCFYFYCYL